MFTLLGEIISVIVALCVLTWLFKAIAAIILTIGGGVLALLIRRIRG